MTPRFDLKRQNAKHARALCRNAKDADFLHVEAARIIGERLAVTNRNFRSPVLLFNGTFSKRIEKTILAESPPIEAPFAYLEKPSGDDEILALEPDSSDLIISIFDLHRVNNLPGILLQINHALKADGLFMAMLPCEGTLEELRTAMIKAESETSAGISSRVDLFPHIRQLGDLVRKTGFKLPVVDLEERTVRYDSLNKLINEIRDIGAGNCGPGEIHPLKRETIKKLEKIYREANADTDGKLRTTVAMACINGWKEDQSQQKPLKPGSATKRLSDFL